MTHFPRRALGIAALSALATPPDELVRMAADVGFDFVGVRVQKVTDQDPILDLAPGSAAFKRLLKACQDTGITVHDTEFMLLDGTDQSYQWKRSLEISQALGAKTFTVAASDPDEMRLTERLASMAQEAASADITITLEPISYQSVRSVEDAARIAECSGIKILADTLHLHRGGIAPQALEKVAPWVAALQLVDAAEEVPADREALIFESRNDRRAPGDGVIDMRSYLNALPDTLPVSVECVSASFVQEHGAAVWVKKLYQAARVVIDSSDKAN
ncbi:sugar phosphate isomerase/epimerase family protein [Rothia nasimurium]|uniref:sugar phosphate isomerase/epimerase family protein n=1 Tax=Rothia nasimurium TaxID=85336 RepID=UPI003BA34D93